MHGISYVQQLHVTIVVGHFHMEPIDRILSKKVGWNAKVFICKIIQTQTVSGWIESPDSHFQLASLSSGKGQTKFKQHVKAFFDSRFQHNFLCRFNQIQWSSKSAWWYDKNGVYLQLSKCLSRYKSQLFSGDCLLLSVLVVTKLWEGLRYLK